MTLLVLDTNALRRGHFSAKALNEWLEAVGENADVFIPEVVIWEWAEHAASARETLQTHWKAFKVDGALYELPTLPDQVPIEALVQRITELLPGSVHLWRPPTAAWKQAVKEQILQIKSGERKEGVKTGAADSIVLACVREQVDNRRNTQAVLLATNDKRLKSTCSRLYDEEVLVVESTGALLSRLLDFAPAAAELLEETEEDLRRIVTDTTSELGAALETFDMGFWIHTSEEPRGRPTGDGRVRSLARLGVVDIVELHDLRIAQEDQGRVGIADVRIFATVHMTEIQLRDTPAGTPEWVTTFDGSVTGGFVDLAVAVTWDSHWNIESVSPTGPAVIVFDSSEYNELDVPPFHVSPSS